MALFFILSRLLQYASESPLIDIILSNLTISKDWCKSVNSVIIVSLIIDFLLRNTTFSNHKYLISFNNSL